MIKALALVIDEHKIIKPLEQIEGLEIEYVIVDENYRLTFPYPDIILTVSDWRAEIARLLLDAKTLNIPTLMFQDGTLDWIIQYEGDNFGGNGGPTHFHPILTDKIAVIGHQSARLIASWNDPSKVEIVGFPILQNEIDESKIVSENLKIDISKKINVLVTSTRQGWFCERQKIGFIEALEDLKIFFNSQNIFNVTWRLSRDLSSIIGVENTLKIKESSELVSLIKEADIVISAQSTVVIEAMLFRKPVAILDYLNVPQYYNTAWLINSKNHIRQTIENMLIKEPNRMLFQDYQLNDVLEIKNNSIINAGNLIEKMVKYRKNNEHADFPTNMLCYQRPFEDLHNIYSLVDIYPKIKNDYKNVSVNDLCLLITRYRRENEQLRLEISKSSLFINLIGNLKIFCINAISNFKKNRTNL